MLLFKQFLVEKNTNMQHTVNTYTQFIPLQQENQPNIIAKNECYFSMIFLGGNYLSSGSIFQKIFGGRDDVALIAGLRLEPDGLLITAVEEPNVVIDKRSIKPGSNTNIPMLLNILVKIPAYMNSIGFSFKVATTKRSDNLSVTLDVLNGNKGVLDGLTAGVVGKVLGIGKVVKDLFDKLDTANNNGLIQLVVNDFIVPASSASYNQNDLQEGYLVIFVKEELENTNNNESFKNEKSKEETFTLEDVSGNEKKLPKEQTVFIDVKQLEENRNNENTAETAVFNLEFDEANKILTRNGKIVTNTYLVFKFQKDASRGENLNSAWSRKFALAVGTLSNEFTKTSDKLKELQPKAVQLFNEATALLAEESGYLPSEKNSFIMNYRNFIEAEIVKFK